MFILYQEINRYSTPSPTTTCMSQHCNPQCFASCSCSCARIGFEQILYRFGKTSSTWFEKTWGRLEKVMSGSVEARRIKSNNRHLAGAANMGPAQVGGVVWTLE